MYSNSFFPPFLRRLKYSAIIRCAGPVELPFDIFFAGDLAVQNIVVKRNPNLLFGEFRASLVNNAYQMQTDTLLVRFKNREHDVFELTFLFYAFLAR